MQIKLVPLSEDRLFELCALWNRALGPVFPMRELLLRQNAFDDPNILADGSRIAIDQATDAAIGFVVAKAWLDSTASEEDAGNIGSETGWIHAILVDADYRNKGIGGLLLEHAETALKRLGVRRISLGGDLHRRVMPGIPEMPDEDTSHFFKKRGYACLRIVHDLLNEYTDGRRVELPTYNEDSGHVVFRIASSDDREGLLSFMRRCFPGRWAYQADQYWRCGGTGREFVLLEREGEIVGFCRINDFLSPILAQNVYWAPLFDGELGGIGPLGIDERYRGLNYGLAIVQAGIHFLRERDVARIVIDTTPYVDFYAKHGYQVWKSYGIYVKERDQ